MTACSAELMLIQRVINSYRRFLILLNVSLASLFSRFASSASRSVALSLSSTSSSLSHDVSMGRADLRNRKVLLVNSFEVRRHLLDVAGQGGYALLKGLSDIFRSVLPGRCG